MNRSVTVIGAGAWGTALAIVLASRDRPVQLCCRSAEHATEINRERANRRYLPDAEFPSGLLAVGKLSELDPDPALVVLAIPFQSIRDMLASLEPDTLGDGGIVCASKGIEIKTHTLAHEIVAQELGAGVKFAMLSGPNFATEVARRQPAAVTIASANDGFAKFVAQQFHTSYFRPYASDDVIAVQIGGAVKNVIAIAAGIADGLELGANARAALITRGLAEIARFGVARGGRMETFMGLSGLGDLVLTATDDQSRNRRFGLAIARGSSVDDAVCEIGLVEGAKTAIALAEIARDEKIEMPISAAVAAVIAGDLSPSAAVQSLLERDLGRE